MAGCIVQVWFDPDTESPAGSDRFVVIETELEDFASFCELVDEDRLIGGAILWTRRTGNREQTITRRVPCAIRGRSIRRCQLPTWQYIEQET